MSRKGRDLQNARGFALIAVLWFLVLIAAIGSYLMASARSEAALARNIRASANAEALADAGIAQAVFTESEPVLINRWPLDGAPHGLRLNGGEITIRVYDETAKINPNLASDALLSGLFQALGIDRVRARKLGAALADWVGSDKQARPLGAKLEQYRAAGKSYGPPNAPLETLDEIQLVLGMTPEIFALVQPYLTIYTGSEVPDAAMAGPVIKRALDLAKREEASIDAAKGHTATNEPGGFDPDAPSPVQVSPAGIPGAQTGQPKAPEQILHVNVIARGADGGVFVRDAVVRIDSNHLNGYAVLAWRRSALPE